MAWLFGQVWLLCAAAFLLGSLVTWLVFVVPARRAPAGHAGHGWRPSPQWSAATWAPSPTQDATAAEPVAEPAPQPGPPVDPALAALDARRPAGPPRTGPGVTASGVLDLFSPSPGQPSGPGVPGPRPTD